MCGLRLVWLLVLVCSHVYLYVQACVQALMQPHCENTSRRFTLGVQTPEPLLVSLLQAKVSWSVQFQENWTQAFFAVVCHISASTTLKEMELIINLSQCIGFTQV